MYDRGKDLNLKNFRDISYLAAMGKVGLIYFISLLNQFYARANCIIRLQFFYIHFTFIKVLVVLEIQT